ncbi:MAG: alpha/beta hydrolase [Rhodocyclales bacterium]|nr:alpha/beta hydrolase [Rhodocyclales bacterium]
MSKQPNALPTTAPGAATQPTCATHSIPVPGGQIHARSWTPPQADPERPPVILFHDSLGCVELWRSFPAALAHALGRRVIAYDRLGFGASDPRHDTLSLDFIREEATLYLPHVLAAFGVERFIACGHSVGGGMAVHSAAAHPERCVALITMAAQCFVENLTRAGIVEARDQFADPTAFARLERYHGPKARWVLNAWTETWLSPAFADWSLHPILPAVRCPTLVIHGAQDEYGSADQPRAIAAGVAGAAELVLMPDTRHVPHREREGAVVGVIGGWCVLF